MPFFALAMSHIAVSHLSKPSGESSKIEPFFTLNCLLHALHCQVFRVERKECSTPPQNGQVTPFGHRRLTANCQATSLSANMLTASRSVFGNLIPLLMHLL